MIYEDFWLTFRRGERLLVRASSPGGEASVIINAEKLRRLAQHLAEQLDPRRKTSGSTAGSTDLRDLGGTLFNTVFSGAVAEVFHHELGRRSEGAAPRFRLRIGLEPEDNELAWLEDIAWEVIFCPRLDSFLALDSRFSIVRSLPVPYPLTLATPQSSLRCLGVASVPRGVRGIDVRAERKKIEKILSSLPGLQFKTLPSADQTTLRRQLIDGRFQALHFMGHGYRRQGQSGVTFGLVLEDEFMGPDRVASQNWADLIKDTGLRLVVLNACHSAERTAGDNVECDTQSEPFNGVAQRLVRAGLPAVVAMRREISDSGARAFSAELYRLLGAGTPIDAAMVEARKAVERARTPPCEWAVPSLFLRGVGEELFRIESEKVSEAPPRSAPAAGIQIGRVRAKDFSARSGEKIAIDEVDTERAVIEARRGN